MYIYIYVYIYIYIAAFDKAWQLLNVEFPPNASSLTDKPPGEGTVIKIITDMVSKAINKMNFGKAAGRSGIILEMIKAANNELFII